MSGVSGVRSGRGTSRKRFDQSTSITTMVKVEFNLEGPDLLRHVTGNSPSGTFPPSWIKRRNKSTRDPSSDFMCCLQHTFTPLQLEAMRHAKSHFVDIHSNEVGVQIFYKFWETFFGSLDDQRKKKVCSGLHAIYLLEFYINVGHSLPTPP